MSMFSLVVKRPRLPMTPLHDALTRVAPRIVAAGYRGVPRPVIVACIYQHVAFDDAEPAQTHEAIRSFVDTVLDAR